MQAVFVYIFFLYLAVHRFSVIKGFVYLLLPIAIVARLIVCYSALSRADDSPVNISSFFSPPLAKGPLPRPPLPQAVWAGAFFLFFSQSFVLVFCFFSSCFFYVLFFFYFFFFHHIEHRYGFPPTRVRLGSGVALWRAWGRVSFLLCFFFYLFIFNLFFS
jgi:hypothetical protein